MTVQNVPRTDWCKLCLLFQTERQPSCYFSDEELSFNHPVSDEMEPVDVKVTKSVATRISRTTAPNKPQVLSNIHKRIKQPRENSLHLI